MTATEAPIVSEAIPQRVVAPLTNAAIFLIVTVNASEAGRAAVRSLCSDIGALVRAVGYPRSEGRSFVRDGRGV